MYQSWELFIELKKFLPLLRSEANFGIKRGLPFCVKACFRSFFSESKLTPAKIDPPPPPYISIIVLLNYLEIGSEIPLGFGKLARTRRNWIWIFQIIAHGGEMMLSDEPTSWISGGSVDWTITLVWLKSRGSAIIISPLLCCPLILVFGLKSITKWLFGDFLAKQNEKRVIKGWKSKICFWSICYIDPLHSLRG